MKPVLDRTLLLGGILALAGLFFLLRWGFRLLKALWRRMNVRRGLPYLKHSISSYGLLVLVALATLAAGSGLVAADLASRRLGRLTGEAARVGTLTVTPRGGGVVLRLDPEPTAPFPVARAEVPGRRWRLTGRIVQYSGLWRLLGLPDGYRPDRVEGASGPRGRPASWTRAGRPLLPEDPWVEAWLRVVARLPGARVIPHATEWEEAAAPSRVELVVVPDGYLFIPAEPDPAPRDG